MSLPPSDKAMGEAAEHLAEIGMDIDSRQLWKLRDLAIAQFQELLQALS